MSIRGTEQILFQIITKALNVNKNSYIVVPSSSITDSVNKAINTYKNDPSIMLVKQKLGNVVDHFSFKEVFINEIDLELRELNSNKTTTFDNAPTKILKQSCKSCSDTLQKLFNDALRNVYFPDELKCADVTPVLEKDDPTKGKGYKPVSVTLTNYCPFTWCGYRKGFGTQRVLLSHVKNGKMC